MYLVKNKRIQKLIVNAIILMMISGCAQTQLVVHAVKELKQQTKEKVIAPQKGNYKVGNPYQIEGIWYYPKVEYNYDETGVASWYGKKFHKKATANGELFDMNLVSAAHRTLPLPSMVQVINLKNGRSIKARVNDRGPFARGRIIDMSRRAAELLGFEQEGTALVRVRILVSESRQLAQLASNGTATDAITVPIAAPRTAVDSVDLPAIDGTKEAKPIVPNKGVNLPAKTTLEPEASDTPSRILTKSNTETVVNQASDNLKIYIQAGAFIRFENANKLKAILSTIGEVEIQQVQITGRPLFRVRLGPIQSLEEAEGILAAVINAGYSESRLIVE